MSEKSVYLAGPIHAVEDDGIGWRERVGAMETGFESISPPVQHNHEKSTEMTDAAVRSLDRSMIDDADAMLVRYQLVPSWGTPREMEYVSEYGTGPDIPVIVWTTVPEQEWSVWLTDADWIGDELDAAVDAVAERL